MLQCMESVVPSHQATIKSPFNTMSISRTVCWKDGDDKVVPVAAHKFLSISRDQMITYRIPHASA